MSPLRFSCCVLAFGFLLSADHGAQALGEVTSALTYAEGQGGFTGVLGDNDRFGLAVDWLGDLDGDGNEDLGVGAPGTDVGGLDRGAIWILFLNSDRTVKSNLRIDSATPGLGLALVDQGAFGSDLVSMGDIDADGVPDIAVGEPASFNAGEAGRVHVLFMNSDGSIKGDTVIGDGLAGFPLGLDLGDSFGLALANMGDIDGNGTNDLAVGRSLNQTFYTLRLKSDGTVKGAWEVGNNLGGFPGNSVAGLGAGLANVGDLDGDGVSDLAVGDSGNIYSNVGSSSASWIAFMASNGTATGAVQTHSLSSVFSVAIPFPGYLGSDVAALGDIDGDGVPDAAFGSPGTGEKSDSNGSGVLRGALWIELLRTDGTIRKSIRISDSMGDLPFALADRSYFGSALACPGDLDGDGVPELIVGAPGTAGDGPGSEPEHGAVHLLYLVGNNFPPKAVVRNGTGINDPCMSSVDKPSIGQTWNFDVDLSFFPGATMGGFVIYVGGLNPGFVFQGEEFLIDFVNGYLVSGAYGTIGSAYGVGIPDDASILGVDLTAQFFILPGPGTFQLCNAIDLTLGN